MADAANRNVGRHGERKSIIKDNAGRLDFKKRKQKMWLFGSDFPSSNPQIWGIFYPNGISFFWCESTKILKYLNNDRVARQRISIPPRVALNRH